MLQHRLSKSASLGSTGTLLHLPESESTWAQFYVKDLFALDLIQSKMIDLIQIGLLCWFILFTYIWTV